MRDLRGALNRVDDFTDTAVSLPFIERAPRGQRNEIDGICLLDLGIRWGSTLSPSGTAPTNLTLVTPIAPASDENLLAQQCPSAMRTRPLGTTSDEPFLHALRKDVSKPVLLRVFGHHDKRRPSKDGPFDAEHGVHGARNVRMNVLNESA